MIDQQDEQMFDWEDDLMDEQSEQMIDYLNGLIGEQDEQKDEYDDLMIDGLDELNQTLCHHDIVDMMIQSKER